MKFFKRKTKTWLNVTTGDTITIRVKRKVVIPEAYIEKQSPGVISYKLKKIV